MRVKGEDAGFKRAANNRQKFHEIAWLCLWAWTLNVYFPLMGNKYLMKNGDDDASSGRKKF